jgi:hypothetical protein
LFAVFPGIAITTVTNGVDGPTLLEGSNVTWSYTVTNVGNVGLSQVTVRDNRFPGETMRYVSGDVNGDGVLAVGETWIFERSGTAGNGSYSNVGSVTGIYTNSQGQTQLVSASDPSNYLVGASPGLPACLFRCTQRPP